MDWIREPSGVSRGWKTSISFKHILDVEPNEETAREASQKAHALLEEWRAGDLPVRFSIDTNALEDISDQFHTIGFVDQHPSVDEFDLLMNALYDWADEQRVLIR